MDWKGYRSRLVDKEIILCSEIKELINAFLVHLRREWHFFKAFLPHERVDLMKLNGV